MEIPKTHQAIMPYLTLNNATAFLEFTKNVFKAVSGMKHMRDQQSESIMHAEVTFKGSTIMFADAGDQWPVANANLFIYVDDAVAKEQRGAPARSSMERAEISQVHIDRIKAILLADDKSIKSGMPI